MRIKTRFILTISFTGGILVIAAGALAITNFQAQKVRALAESAEVLSWQASELNYLTGNSLVYPEDDEIARWNASLNTFMSEIEGFSATASREQAALAQNMSVDARRLKEIFDEAVTAVRRSPHNASSGLFRMSWMRLAMQNQSLIADSRRLALQVGEQAERMAAMRSVFLYLFFGVTGLFLLINYSTMYRRIIQSLVTLRKGAQIISSGDLDFKIKKEKDDEIGEVAEAFNEMVSTRKRVEEDLKAYKDELEELVGRRTVELRNSEEKFRTLADTAPVIILVYRGDKHLYANESAVASFGYSKEELVRMNFIDLVHPDFRAMVREKVQRRMRGDKASFHYEVKVNTKDGSDLWLEIFSNPIIYEGVDAGIAVCTDITERKRVARALGEEKDKLSLLLQSISDEVWFSDLEGKFILINPPALREFNLREGEIDVAQLASSLEVFRSDGSRRPVEEAPPLRALKGEVIRNCEEIIRTPVRGELRYRQVSATPVRDASGTIIGSVSVVRDITELKKAEEVLRRDKETVEELVRKRTGELINAQMELERAKRLSDIGVLATTVAHELRNPLAAINMASYNIKRKAKNPDLERHLLNISKKIAESDQIINNLLFYSRLRPPAFENARIYDILVESIEDKRKRGVSMKRDIDSLKNVSLEADPVQIKEVFNNILNNACDAVSTGTGEIRIRSEDEGTFVTIHITDNGCGIDAQTLPKVFDPFFTTKATGTGLGLSVCQQIVKFHEGSIDIASEPEQGTTVTIRLPKMRKKLMPA